ncbi:MAG: glucose-6-phosphate isomerase [Bacillota bacterium]|jgi:glucose-6-phosphate isomerase
MPTKILLNTEGLAPFLRGHELRYLEPAVAAAHRQLADRTGPGSEFLGWLDLPEQAKAQTESIRQAAEAIRRQSDALVVIGIGGSYLGARAAIEALGNSFHNLQDGKTKVFFAGHNLSSAYHADLLDLLKDMDFSVSIISKSGTTTEPAIAFRLCKKLLEEKYGKEGARRRIFAITDATKGALRSMASQEGYAAFAIPGDVGGRYSVLSPVGLLPMAVAGIDIDPLVAGASQAREELNDPDLAANPCYQYAACRAILHRKGKAVELLTAYEPGLQTFAEWWKQLFGESEGKDGKGIFPASAIFSTDLHSLGQFIQDGSNLLFETVLKVNAPRRDLEIPRQEEDLDQLNYLAGKTVDFVNTCAFQGTLQAHTQGQTPNIVIELPDLTAHTLGYLFFFMEKACALSGYLLGVNPFDQPGVEAYKRNMFALLGKPKNNAK